MPQDEMTAEEAKAIVFRSPDRQLILIRTPGRSYTNERGELITIEGKRYEFQPHGTFGQLTGLEPDDIGWLREHKLNGRHGGFVEVGNEPDRERPTVNEALAEIAKCAARRDAEALAAIYQREIESYDRDAVKEAATQALAAIEEVVEEEGAEPVEEEALATEG
jgi:hypothetical protein